MKLAGKTPSKTLDLGPKPVLSWCPFPSRRTPVQKYSFMDKKSYFLNDFNYLHEKEAHLNNQGSGASNQANHERTGKRPGERKATCLEPLQARRKASFMQISKDTALFLAVEGDTSARETLKKVHDHITKPWNADLRDESAVEYRFCDLTKRVYATVAGTFC